MLKANARAEQLCVREAIKQFKFLVGPLPVWVQQQLLLIQAAYSTLLGSQQHTQSSAACAKGALLSARS
jgi:hypothetical protein